MDRVNGGDWDPASSRVARDFAVARHTSRLKEK